jgi:hypothetical protein
MTKVSEVNKNGRIVFLLVLNEHKLCVGHGYVLYYAGELSGVPLLINNDGDILPEGWFNLVGTSERVVVINETIQ